MLARRHPHAKTAPDQPLRETEIVGVGPASNHPTPTFPQVMGLQVPASMQSPVRHYETEKPVTRRNTMVSKGGLELRKYVCLLVLWKACLCWSDFVFACPCAYVRVSDIR